MKLLLPLLCLSFCLLNPGNRLVADHSDKKGDWLVKSTQSDPDRKRLDCYYQGVKRAQFVYGDGEMKPYLHLFDSKGIQITKGGPEDPYQHHRGVFIGWNRVQSDAGSFDLWHIRNRAEMRVVGEPDSQVVNLDGKKGSATIEATILWRGAGEIQIRETRTMKLSMREDKGLVLDFSSLLEAQKDLRLNGDLQHAGIHFRANYEVAQREKETAYLYEPADRTIGEDLKWVRFHFPLANQWYAVQQLNAPENPVESLSTRNYGRFGYFFKRDLDKGDSQKVNYRFVVEEIPALKEAGKLSKDEAMAYRNRAQSLYDNWVVSQKD